MQYDHEEMQEILGRSFAVDQDVDEDELMGELDLIEDELALEAAAPTEAVPAFLEEPDLPTAPQGLIEPPRAQQIASER
jgi:charged multivesicular body protein 5